MTSPEPPAILKADKTLSQEVRPRTPVSIDHETAPWSSVKIAWQRTSLARNRNADRVGIHCFIKEKICLTAMIGIARRLRRSGPMEERSAAYGKVDRCFCSRQLVQRAASAAQAR